MSPRKKNTPLPRRSLLMMAASLLAVMITVAYFIGSSPTATSTRLRATVYQCAQCGKRNVHNNPHHFIPDPQKKQSKNFVPTITAIGHGQYRPTIETKRLLLREVTLADAPTLFSYFSKVESIQSSNYEHHTHIEQTNKLVTGIVDDYRKGKTAHWAICDKTTKKIMGLGGFVSMHPTHNRGTIGWFLDEQFWGQGFGTEVARAVIEYGMRYLHLNRIDAVIRVENIASHRVVQKAGMSWTATFKDYWRVKDDLGTFYQFVVLKKDIAPQLKKSTIA